MAKATSIRCYDYVNHSYEKVCEILAWKGNEVFHQATKSAESRAESVAAGLHAKIAGIDVAKDIVIQIKGLVEADGNLQRKTSIELEWEAADAPRLFPVMKAQLHIYPITGTETQLDFQGEYEPPLGVVGKAIDAVVGHRIAEASVHHFIYEVAGFLRDNID